MPIFAGNTAEDAAMARLFLAIVLAAAVFAIMTVAVLGLRAIWREAQVGSDTDMADNGFMPRLAFFLLLALILYVTFWSAA
jgi:hypothetical protein